LLAEYIEPLIEEEKTTILGGIINGADIPVNFAENPSEFLPEYPPTTDSLEQFEPSGSEISLNSVRGDRSKSSKIA
jgi:hypothetical protein